MISTKVQEQLFNLGYTKKWLDFGVLTEDKLRDQIKELELGIDDNQEHYRYKTLLTYFNEQTSFDDLEIENVLALLKSDSDKSMASSATLELLKKPFLDNNQFNAVASFLQTFGDWTKKHIAKAIDQRIKNDQ